MLLGIFCTNLSFFNTASGMDCMKLVTSRNPNSKGAQFQYRKRYGLHAIKLSRIAGWKFLVSIPQAVWIACNASQKFLPSSDRRSFNTASGMDCMQFRISPSGRSIKSRFNTASGMDCMQYRPSQPLGQLNPEAGFLNGALFLANRRNLAGFFCRQNRLKTSANPVISRKLLSTGKI